MELNCYTRKYLIQKNTIKEEQRNQKCMMNIENKRQSGRCNFNHIKNNTTKYEWIKQPDQEAKAIRLDFKKTITIHCLQEIHATFKDPTG